MGYAIRMGIPEMEEFTNHLLILRYLIDHPAHAFKPDPDEHNQPQSYYYNRRFYNFPFGFSAVHFTNIQRYIVIGYGKNVSDQ